MGKTYNVYCDESCHLENDHQKVMVLGAIWCDIDKVQEISARIREIKVAHKISPKFEVKWTKVSPSQQSLYLDLIDYFFDDDDLHFRALVVDDKEKLRHVDFEQDHDTWYYKMYFDMLKVILTPENHYRIYLDIKDTRSSVKVKKLHDALCNNIYDFKRQIIHRLQTVRSHEIEVMQLADLLIGAVSAANRKKTVSLAKKALIERLRKRSAYSLEKSTLLREEKVNLFHWNATETQA